MTIQPDALNPDFARFCKESREDREAVYTDPVLNFGNRSGSKPLPTSQKINFVSKASYSLVHGDLYFRVGW